MAKLKFVSSHKHQIFGDLIIGEVFRKDVIWMKITEVRNIHGCTCNAIDLETGRVYCFSDNDEVKSIYATLTVESDCG